MEFEFFMTDRFRPVTLGALAAGASLVHGFSPRRILDEKGQCRELDFGRDAGARARKGDTLSYLRALGISGDSVFGVRQVHGDKVHVLKQTGVSIPGEGPVEADAVVTHLPNRPIAVLTADCIPLILYDPRCHVTGVVHAGRLGTSLHILSKSIAALRDNYGSRPADLIVGMGPGICGACYEVDEAAIEPFRAGYARWEQWVEKRPAGKYLLDLFAANRDDAEQAGVPPLQIHQTGLCTSCHNDRFYSYRKEGARGRMMALAMLASR